MGMAYALAIAWLITRLYDAIHQHLFPAACAADDRRVRRPDPAADPPGPQAIVWVLAVIIGLNNAGYDVGTVLAGLGIGGLAVALAAQDTVANIFGGITLFAQKPFLIGDLIEFEGKQYVVKEIGWRATIAEDWNTGYRVTIPNSQVHGRAHLKCVGREGVLVPGDHPPVAWTSGPRMSSGAPGHQGLGLLPPTHRRHKVRFEGFGVNAFELLVLFHVSSFDHRWQVITDANLDLIRRFEEHGIRHRRAACR